MKYDFYITGEIGTEYDWWTGQRGTTVNMVRRFLDEHKDQDVTIAVSSPGGYLDQGITMGELIKAHGRCHMVLLGMTASAATVLCMKAKSVKMARGSMMLIHNSSVMLDVWTSANKHGVDELIAKFKAQKENLDTCDKAIADIYSCRNHKTMEENLGQMDKEKWMLAQDALDFGLVDAIVDDEETVAQSEAVKNAYGMMQGVTDHYGLPALPEGTVLKKQPKRFVERLKSAIGQLKGIINDSETIEEPNVSPVNIKGMKKVIFNVLCALLCVQDFSLNEKGEAVLTEEQLKAVEDELKAKSDLVKSLEDQKTKAENDKAKAEKDKADAETALANLQKEFDDFKSEAGDTTLNQPVPSGKGEAALNSTEMYNEIKNLL